MGELIGNGPDEGKGEMKREFSPTVRITDPAEVRKLFKVRLGFEDISEELIQMISETGAIHRGHFDVTEDCLESPIPEINSDLSKSQGRITSAIQTIGRLLHRS